MQKYQIKNLKLLTSIKTMLPALHFICQNEKEIDAFLCPGHVSVMTGSNIYTDLAVEYQKPFVIAGFEGELILAAIYEIVQQIKEQAFRMKNMYTSAVSEEGNQKAAALVDQYFTVCDEKWRGIGVIQESGLRIKEEYKQYDAGSKFKEKDLTTPKGCKCTEVILGRIHPVDCPLFDRVCNPLNAIGPCMVSTEGACGIWYKNRGNE
jgi:hydrogenase expression/formation protein HypD